MITCQGCHSAWGSQTHHQCKSFRAYQPPVNRNIYMGALWIECLAIVLPLQNRLNLSNIHKNIIQVLASKQQKHCPSNFYKIILEKLLGCRNMARATFMLKALWRAPDLQISTTCTSSPDLPALTHWNKFSNSICDMFVFWSQPDNGKSVAIPCGQLSSCLLHW